MTGLFIQLRSATLTWLAGFAMATAAALAGCGKGAEPPADKGPKVAKFRAPGRWFRDLQADFSSYANPANEPDRYRVERLADFDSMASELRQDTVLTLASAYSTTNLPCYANSPWGEALPVEMLQEVHVLVVDTACVREFARNGWLTPFDQGILDLLKETGVVPIRAVGPDDKEIAPPVYGIPLTRGADFAFYRKSCFAGSAARANGTRAGDAISPAVLLDSTSRVATDGQEFWRFFLALVWSEEPDWPRQANGAFAVDTPAARRVLEALRRSTQLGPLASASNRMKFSSQFQTCFDSFAGTAAGPSAATQPSACWLLSTSGQRILIAPWGLPVKLSDIGFLPLTASVGTAGCSLETGQALVMTRRLSASDRDALSAREVAGKLAGYLLSKLGQRDLVLDQFQVPARPGVLDALTVKEVAAVFGARHAGLDDRTYQKKLKAGELTLDEDSLQFGERTLSLLRQMEKTLNDSASLRLVGSNPLSMHQCSLIDRMLHELLAKPNTHPADGAASPEDANPVARALQRLREQLEVDQRFVAQSSRNLSRASAP